MSLGNKKGLKERWVLDFGIAHERILGFDSNKDSLQDRSTVPVAVRADATVLYKFLNPSLLVILTESHKVHSLNLYIVNAVNGQMVHQARILDGVLPAKFLVVENWTILHYWNYERLRFEVYVVDLYEHRKDDGPSRMLWDTYLGGYFELLGLKGWGRTRSPEMSGFQLEHPAETVILMDSEHLSFVSFLYRCK